MKFCKRVDCTASAPFQDKLKVLAKLYGQYSVHTLCEVLCVSRGTFYNHIFRRKDVTAYDKHRAEMKEHIHRAFDESQQRFGANKMAEQGVHISPKYVAELMREMGLQGADPEHSLARILEIAALTCAEYGKSLPASSRQKMIPQQHCHGACLIWKKIGQPCSCAVIYKMPWKYTEFLGRCGKSILAGLLCSEWHA